MEGNYRPHGLLCFRDFVFSSNAIHMHVVPIPTCPIDYPDAENICYLT